MKKFKVFIPMFLILLLISGVVKPIITSESISQKVFRLHILANSDSTQDQNLKLLVKDEILKLSCDVFVNAKSVNEAKHIAEENIKAFENVAQKVIEDNGYTYKVSAYTDEEYFNTRKYDGFVMPAGEYSTLKIVIGSGEGHNWWCVMYPSVCISGCTDDFDEIMNDEEKEMLTSSKFVPKFKFIELYESIKNKIIS